MALKLNERYPSRFNNPSADYPHGSFKNRTSPTAKDGSYLEQDWANDKEGFFQSLISAAGVVPSGLTDKVGASQYYDALLTVLYAAARKTPILNDTGVAGAYAAVNTPALTALPSTGYMQRVKIANLNTGASTYAPDGLAAKPIYGLGLQSLQGGELPPGVAVLMYLVQAGVNGGNGAWIIIESLGGASQVAPATRSQHAPNTGQMQAGFGTYALDTGGTNIIVAALSPAPAALVDGMLIRVLIAAGNTGVTTLNLNGLGAKAVQGLGAAALQGGELVTGGRAMFIWAAAQNSWILQSCQAAPLQVGDASKSHHAMTLGQATGRLINIQYFTASGTYTATPGTATIVAEGQGGGGAGGGVAAIGAGVAAGGGGGSAGTVAATARTAAPGPTAVTIGAGGLGLAGNTGGSGGQTILAGILACPGGGGGVAGTPSSTAFVTAPGGTISGAATGTFAWAGFGERGKAGVALSSTSAIGGDGGSSIYGGGGSGPGNNGTSATAGSNAGGFGGGGGGGVGIGSGAAVAGGNGGAGFLIVYEYS